MEFHPTSVTVGSALAEKSDFFVPHYQRAYAWERDQLDDFFADLDGLLSARRNGEEKKHFFGSIVVG